MAKKTRRKTTRQKRIEQRQAEKRRNNLAGIAIIVVLLGVFGFTAFNHLSQPAAPAVAEERLNDFPAKGPADAAVVITEFGDFGCHSCQQWHELGFFDQMIQQFGDRIRIEWRDFPVITPQSPLAAEAGQCAHDQGLFWRFHDITYERESFSALLKNDLRFYAEQAGADMEQFDQCLDSNQHSQTVDLNRQAAFSLGLRGTPGFAINGQPMAGPDPNLMVSIINQQLGISQ
ncbi:MAG: hypothetical protein DWQ07_02340 [Chloroflexi bacterium]|nr:MAG: hypothetical protein DWQ07_02340 [Chloroflexota bacterium]MBL1193662.1 hypothetical protein [Chloroflexota bacterium]NOH10954.1 thioredoxin domain-containing protein [Chloroflexota bacterium]